MPRSNNRSPHQLLNQTEAAQLLSVHPRTIKNWTAEDRIPYVTLPNGQRRYPQQALLASLGGNFSLVHSAQAADSEVVEERMSELEQSPEKSNGALA